MKNFSVTFKIECQTSLGVFGIHVKADARHGANRLNRSITDKVKEREVSDIQQRGDDVDNVDVTDVTWMELAQNYVVAQANLCPVGTVRLWILMIKINIFLCHQPGEVQC